METEGPFPPLASLAIPLATAVLAASSSPGPTAAQGVAASGEGGEAVRAVRRTGPVEMDGRPGEAAWSAAVPADDFVQARPDEGAPPARRTEVRVLFDDRALWIGVRLHDDPEAIRHQLVRRDGEGAFDLVRVELDPDGDDRTGYLFRVSAAGAERDAFLHDDTRVDESWDAVWTSAVNRDTEGWSAEMRIPLSEIDFVVADTGRAWGVNVVRRRLASDSESMLFLRSRTRSGRVSQFGPLLGIRPEGGGGSLQLEPYVTAQARSAEPGDPFSDGTSLVPRAGLDLSWSLASNVTVDATLNPGFGQVEVDPAVVNLTAFETFFPERRPFFTQDARIFDVPLSGPQRVLFHSRRIGREPRGEPPPGAGAVKVPDATSILGAAKLTGRTPGGTSFGVMGAVTARETGRAFFPGEGATRSFLAQPRAQHGVARVEQDLRGGATRVGAVLAGVHRELPASGAFEELARTAVAGGVDFEHRWGGDRRRRYALWGYVAGSRVAGTRDAVTAIQRNANHYFQRPDAGYKRVDSTATSLVGREWRLQVERRSAEHWTWAAWVNEVSPGFVIDDVGFAGATLPRIDVGGQLRYQDITPGPLFRSWSVRFDTFHDFRHGLLDAPLDPGAWSASHEGGRFLLDGSFELRGGWEAGLAASWAPATLTERETRGGPLMRDPATVGASARVRTDPRDDVNLGVTVDVEDSGRAGSALDASADLELRPSPGWEIRTGPTYSLRTDRAQFVTATDVVPYAPTFGRRYLFADVRREELGMEARLDVAFTPDLGLQVYAQPLLSSADFRAYKQLERPGSFAFLRFEEGGAVVDGDGAVRCRGGRTCVAGGTRHVDVDGDGASDHAFGDRDFSLASLRGNAVLRWEYLSGSELYLVWQQRRRRRTGAGALDVGAGLERLLSADPRDTFLLKVRHHVRF